MVLWVTYLTFYNPIIISCLVPYVPFTFAVVYFKKNLFDIFIIYLVQTKQTEINKLKKYLKKKTI